MLAAGLDRLRKRQKEKRRSKVNAATTLAEIAQEPIDKRRREALSTGMAAKLEYYVARAGPAIARLRIAEITVPDLLAVLRRIEAKGNYRTARRVLLLAGRVLRFAVATARLISDPSRY